MKVSNAFKLFEIRTISIQVGIFISVNRLKFNEYLSLFEENMLWFI